MIETPAIVVIGAGPAGLAAATALCRAGHRPVLVFDRDDAPGGLPRFCHHPGFGWTYTHRLETGPAFARRMVRQSEASGAVIMTGTTVLKLEPGPVVHVVGPEIGYRSIAPTAVVLATGIRETARGPRLVPGARPETGMLTTGALQQHVSRGIALPWRRLVIAGTEHVSFSAILTGRAAGMATVAMVEPATAIQSYAAAMLFARMMGIAMHTGSRIAEVRGRKVVEGVCIEGPDRRTEIACDAVLFSAEWVPESALCATSSIAVDAGSKGPVIDNLFRTSMQGVFAAGNLLRGVESSGIAGLEGKWAGECVAAFLDGRLPCRQGTIAIRPSQELEYFVPQLLSPDTSGTPQLGMERAYFRIRKDCQSGFISFDGPDGAGLTIPIEPTMKRRRHTIAMAQIQPLATSRGARLSARPR